MTDLPERTEDVPPFMDGLKFSDETAELPPPATDPVMVVRSLRLPVELDQRPPDSRDTVCHGERREPVTVPLEHVAGLELVQP